MTHPPIRVGVIGCGQVSQLAHLPALAKTTNMKAVAICDTDIRRAERVAQRFGVDRVCSSPESLLADETVDAVIVALPDRFHVHITEGALAAGKHVLVEKPLGSTADECRALREVAKRSGLKVQIGAMKRHDPGIEYARAFIRDELGPILSGNAWYRASSFKPEWHATMAPPPVDASISVPNTDKADRERYYLATHGSHLFDELLFLLGTVSHVTARHVLREGVHVWHGIVEMTSGAVAHFELAVSLPAPWAEGFTVYGAHGNLRLDTHFPFLLRASDVRGFSADRRQWLEPTFGETDPYKRQLDAFARAVREDVPTSPGIEDGIATLEVIEAVARSAQTGERLSVEG